MSDLVTLRMEPWLPPAIEAGQYLRHRGEKARTAYFVVSVREIRPQAYSIKAERVPIAEIPEDAMIRLFQWHPRNRRKGKMKAIKS